MKLGAARQKAPSAWRLVEVELAKKEATFRYRLRRDKLRQARPPRPRKQIRLMYPQSAEVDYWTVPTSEEQNNVSST
jgi:hypothetical protein